MNISNSTVESSGDDDAPFDSRFFLIRSTANITSFCLTFERPSLIAIIPDSTAVAFSSAPLKPSVFSTIFRDLFLLSTSFRSVSIVLSYVLIRLVEVSRLLGQICLVATMHHPKYQVCSLLQLFSHP